MKVYLAAPYPTRDTTIALMRHLERHGIEVTSTWLKVLDTMSDEAARVCLQDVARADVLVALNHDDWKDKGTGGRHVEFGYALALGKPIVLVGQKSSVFHYLTEIVHTDVFLLVATLQAIHGHPQSD